MRKNSISSPSLSISDDFQAQDSPQQPVEFISILGFLHESDS